MTTRLRGAPADTVTRWPAVAGSFYPADPDRLRALVTWQLGEAEARFPVPVDLAAAVGVLVPHAGLEYSGIVAAAGWRAAISRGSEPPTVVLLGTNHGARWLDGLGAWDRGAWRTPLGEVVVDEDLAAEIVALGAPFRVDREAHDVEHSIEVQLPFLRVLAPESRIVPLAVSAGVGRHAVEAGTRLGTLLATRWAAGDRVLLAISTDMAHYPSHEVAERVTQELLPAILEVDAAALAERETALRGDAVAGLACGMCGIEPAIVGLAALRAAGATRAFAIAAATSADAGGGADRTVGYFSAAFGMG